MPLALTSWNVASFVNCTSLERVHGLEELFTGGYLTEIPSTTFYGCTSLEYLFENNNFPSGIVTIGGSAFENCTSLKTPTFPETLKVTGANSFKNCDALGPIVVFPNSLQTFGQTSLCGCDNIEVVYMGANVTAFGGYDAFNTMAKLTTVYMPALTAMPINTFRNSSNLTTVYYTGTKEQLDLLIADGVKTSGNDYFTKLTPISAKEYEQLEDKIGKYIIYDYNKCDAFYGSIHLEDNNPCVINCAQCNTYGIVEKNPIHSEVLAIVYENGYASKGVKNVTCANEGCNHNVTSEAQELFICFGYSSSKVGNGGMLMAFAVNHKAIEEFEGVSKSSVSYGVFAGLKDRLSTNDAVTADGKAQNGAICADYTEKRFDIIEIKVAGFTSNEHMDAQIVLGAYVIVKKGEETTISYLQDKKPLDNEKYVSRSYNQLID